MSSSVLTLNTGSSSLKFALYDMASGEKRLAAGILDRIGQHDGDFQARDGEGKTLESRQLVLADHAAALEVLVKWLQNNSFFEHLRAVGHRLVHGGPRFTQPNRIDAAVLAALRELVPLAPNHMPQAVKAVESVAKLLPKLPQVGCFDTAFHRTMPARAQTFGLPRQLRDEGVFRYGFHGLSYEYIVEELRQIGGPAAADGRVVIAHLGHGASMAAVHHGRGVDTTMGLTPLGGLVMSQRSGDLDPGIVLYLMREKKLGVQEADDLLNKKSGLLGVSGISSDMKDLLEREPAEPAAAEAVELFCYQAKKFVAAMAAALGGLDTLVFTAGIGENAPAVRARICAGLEFLGIRIDAAKNAANDALISTPQSPATVRVIKTNEELMIARQTYRLLRV